MGDKDDAIDHGDCGYGPMTSPESIKFLLSSRIVIDLNAFRCEKGPQLTVPLCKERVWYDNDMSKVGNGLPASKVRSYLCE